MTQQKSVDNVRIALCLKAFGNTLIWVIHDSFKVPPNIKLNIFHSLPSYCVFLPVMFLFMRVRERVNVCVGTESVCKWWRDPCWSLFSCDLWPYSHQPLEVVSRTKMLGVSISMWKQSSIIWAESLNDLCHAQNPTLIRHTLNMCIYSCSQCTCELVKQKSAWTSHLHILEM